MPMSGCPAKAVEGSVERSERETLTHFTFEAVELRAATICNVLPRVEQADHRPAAKASWTSDCAQGRPVAT